MNWRFIDAAALALSAFIVGYRYAVATLRRELSRTSVDPCVPCCSRLSECSKLLERNAELPERGSDFAQEVVADKDAVVELK